MDEVGFAVVLLLGLGAVVLALLRLAVHARRRGIGHAVLGPFDEVWQPSGGHTHAEAQEQQERVTPAPSPGDGPLDGPGR